MDHRGSTLCCSALSSGIPNLPPSVHCSDGQVHLGDFHLPHSSMMAGAEQTWSVPPCGFCAVLTVLQEVCTALLPEDTLRTVPFPQGVCGKEDAKDPESRGSGLWCSQGQTCPSAAFGC